LSAGTIEASYRVDETLKSTAEDGRAEFLSLRRRIIGLGFAAYYRMPHLIFRPAQFCLHRLGFSKIVSDNRTLIETINGVTYELDLRSFVDGTLYYRRAYEPSTTRTIRKILKRGMTVLDIGANVGYFALLMANLVGDDGHVVAFEPTSYGFEKLRRNVSLNRFENITLENIGLSDQVERKKLWINSRFETSAVTSEEEEEIELQTLDVYFNKSDIGSLDFVKVDVDGYEVKVIRGARNTLSKFQPQMIVEFGRATLKRRGETVEELLRELEQLGYDFYSEDGSRHYSDRKSFFKDLPRDSVSNILCVPRN
jgi:FkbM family methyltransferase